MSDISILVPWRTDSGHRQQLWDWVRPRWEASGFQLCVGTDSGRGPFNIGRAFNDAAEQADGDYLLCFGADEIPDPDHIKAVVDAHHGAPWFGTFFGRCVLNKTATQAVLASNAAGVYDPIHDDRQPGDRFVLAPVRDVMEYRPRGFTQMAIRSDVWADIRGWDPGFVGWGPDDLAVRAKLNCLYGGPPQPSGWLVTFWHPKASRKLRDANQRRYAQYEAVIGDPTKMRALIARQPD